MMMTGMMMERTSTTSPTICAITWIFSQREGGGEVGEGRSIMRGKEWCRVDKERVRGERGEEKEEEWMDEG